MRSNTTKAKLHQGGVAVGCFCNFPSPEVVELCGLLGFDFALIDCEHGAISFDNARHMIRAAEAAGITPLVRTPMNSPQVILRYLDAGALGIQVPQVFTKEDAELAVRSIKFHPLGRRGLAATRAADFGLSGAISDYTQRANEETMVIFHIENMEAFESLDKILEVREIDVFFLGPSDLSQSLGIPGQTTHPRVQEVLERGVRQIREAGRIAGTVAPGRDALLRMTDLGFQYLPCGASILFSLGARALLGK